MIRRLLLAPLLFLAAPAVAKDDVPLSPVGLPFVPMAPRPLPADHPLYRRIALDPVAGMPNVVGGSATLGMMGAARKASFEAGLRETLAALNMLAPTPAAAKVRLTPRWLGLDAPFQIGLTSRATARLGWTLTRIDDGRTIFSRDIATAAESKGGDGGARATGVGRVALTTNIASALLCIDRAAFGQAPADCALTPGFTYQAPRPPLILFYRGR